MIYVSARWADEAQTMVIGTDANGVTEMRSINNPHEFRREDEFITGFLASGGIIGPYLPPPAPAPTIICPTCSGAGVIPA